MENPVSERGHRGMALPLKMLTEVHCGPRNSSDTCRAAECQCHLPPGERSSHRGSIHTETTLTKQGSVSPPRKHRYTGHRTLQTAQVQDSPLPIPSRLPFTFSQDHWEATIRKPKRQASEQHEWCMPTLGRHSLSHNSQSSAAVEDVS